MPVPQSLLSKISSYEAEGYSPDEIVSGLQSSKNYTDVADKVSSYLAEGYSADDILAGIRASKQTDFAKESKAATQTKQFEQSMLLPQRDDRAINPTEAILNTSGPMETPLSGEEQGVWADTKRLGQSTVKAGARVLGTIGRTLEQDAEKVDPYAAGVFGTDVQGEWETDEMGNLNFVRTEAPEKIREAQRSAPTAEAGRWLQEVDESVKSPVYQEGSKLKIAGGVIENAPQSMMYMLPNLLPGGGALSNGLMYQDSYLSKLRELRKAQAEGRIQLNAGEIEQAAVKSALAEVIPEAAGNLAEASVMKNAAKFASKFLPLGNTATIAGRFLNKVKGSQTGASLFADVIAPSATRRIATVAGATAAGMPIEGATEAATQWYQSNQDIDLGLAKVPVGMSRQDFVTQQMKEAAEIGAWSGAVMTGAPTAAQQINAKNKATDLQTTLFAPVNPTQGDVNGQVKNRQEAGQDLLSVIYASNIPQEEKLAATINVAMGLSQNQSIPFSAELFSPDAIKPKADTADHGTPMDALANSQAWDKFTADRVAAESDKVETDTAILEAGSVDEAIQAAEASVNAPVGMQLDEQADLLRQINAIQGEPGSPLNELGIAPGPSPVELTDTSAGSVALQGQPGAPSEMALKAQGLAVPVPAAPVEPQRIMYSHPYVNDGGKWLKVTEENGIELPDTEVLGQLEIRKNAAQELVNCITKKGRS